MLVGESVLVVDRLRLLSMMARALSLEENRMTPVLRGLLRDVERSGLDQKTKQEMTQKIHHLLEETLDHSAKLNEIVKEVTWSGRDDF